MLPRLHGSRQTKERLGLAAPFFLSLVFLCFIWNQALWFSAAAAAACVLTLLVSWLLVVPDARCSLCHRPRAEVVQLVAGTSASVCDDCVVQSGAILNEDVTHGSRWPLLVLRQLPAHSPRAVTSPLLRAAPCADEKALQRLLIEAFRLANPGLVIELISRRDEAERSGSDWVNLGVAYEEEGRLDEALSAARRAGATPDNEPWMLNNVASARLEAGEQDPTVLRGLLADVTRALELLSTRKTSPQVERVRANMHGTRAELHRRLQEPAEAAACLREAARLEGANAWRLLVEGELARDGSRPDEARTHFTAAKLTAHPESRVFERAVALLKALDAPTA
jgi:hypothetical protein